MPPDVRPSPLAGTWYAASPRRLAAEIDACLDAARPPSVRGSVVGIVVPHAGHRYSGAVAAHAFAVLRGLAPRVVALVGPLHQGSPAALLSTGHDAWETPLGVVPVDRAAVRGLDQHLRAGWGLDLARIRDDDEHALEIELPFLQRVLAPGFALLPVMVRSRSPEVTRALGHALARTLQGGSALLVASTDLSHFFPRATAERFDAEMLRRIEAFDPEGVLHADAAGIAFACGAAAVAAVLWAARALGADHVRVLHHATSGDVTGDVRDVVGYGAAAITRAPSPGRR